MNKLLENYLNYKKITIPVTVLVAGLIIGGVTYGVTSSTKDASKSASKETKTKTEKTVTPEYICYDAAGTYSDKATYDAGEITTSDVTVENATFNTLTITEDVGEGSVTLNNDKVKKTLVVNGGGTNSLHINGGEYDEIISNKYNCHIVIDENCKVATLIVPSSALVEVNGTVETANVVPSTYDGEITWETGFKAGEKANISALNISEDVKDVVAVEDTTGKAVKEEKTLSKEQTSKVQAKVEKSTTTAQNSASTAKTNTVNSGANTSASAPSNTTAQTPAQNTTASNTNTSAGNISAGNNNSYVKPGAGTKLPDNYNTNTGNNNNEPEYIECEECGAMYKKGSPHPTGVCPLCGQTVLQGHYHDCPMTYDYYGNKVRKDSKYVVAVGNYDIKKYSDGSYDVPQSARDTLASSYESEKYAYGDNWVNNPRLTSIDAWCISCSGI